MRESTYPKGTVESAQDIANKLLLILGVAVGLSAAGTQILLQPGEASFGPLAVAFSVAFFATWRATAGRWRAFSRVAVVALLFAMNVATQRYFGANFFVFATIAVVAVV